MIDWAAAVPQPGAGANGLVDETLRALDRFDQRQPRRKPGSDGGGIGAARTVSVDGRDPRGRELAEGRAVVEDIGRLGLEVAAFDQDRARTPCVNLLREFPA